MSIKECLRDLVAHTHDLGCFEAVKIVGTESVTEVSSVAGDRSIVMTAVFKKPVKEFEGTFGMPNLAKLKILLSIPEYQRDAAITVSKKNDSPVNMHFSNAANDFQNDYRFMSQEIVNERLKTVKFKGVSWDIECQPNLAAIERFKFQARAHSEQSTFQTKVTNNNLVFCFGDQSNHAGEFVFENNVRGTLKRGWSWPVKGVQSILDLGGDKTLKISDAGACEITVDSGIAEYTYILPAITT